MSDDTARSKRRRVDLWRLLALSGLAAGVTALFRAHYQKASGRGSPGTPPSAEALKAGHETEDISARNVAFILAGMAAATALVVGITFTMIWRFDVNRHAAMSRLTPEETAEIVPPAPHLQQDPFADRARDLSRETRLLTSYGWISADHSLARIPIDRAMALSTGKSLDASP